ncbi:Eukaryotic peptide chain release factor GTP-binding subunit ERF3A, partial [Cichlidogyrus casuarinus]
ILDNEEEVDAAVAGTTCKLKVRGIEEEEVAMGFVLCEPGSLCKVANVFDAQVVIMDYKSIISIGFTAVMHLHSCTEEVQIKLIICRLDKKTGEKTDIKPKFIKKDEIAIVRFTVLSGPICMEIYKDYAQMGRFTLRDEGKTIAVGKILKVLPIKDTPQNVVENG